MAVKNMGTATMRFKEGIKVEGDDPHGSANQLVVTGSISLMEGTGGAVVATLESSANPTTTETTPNDWEFIDGAQANQSHSNHQPRFPIVKVPIDTGGFWEDEIYAFTGSGGSGNMRMISNKNAISGDARIEFMLIGGGNHNTDFNNPYMAGNIRRADQPNATGYPYTLEHQNKVWYSGSSNITYDIQVMIATSGYDASANWTQVGSSSYHAHHGAHPASASRNMNQHQFESFSVDITGISGNYYVALVQDGSSQYNTWAAADINLYSLSGGGSSTSYINFEPQGTFEQGEDGIGFRNNAGFMEYKDEGESWRQFNTLAIGPASPDRSIQFNDGGTLGSGNLFYGSNANVGIGNFPSPPTPDSLLEVRGNLGGGDNAGHMILSDRGPKPPFFNFERYEGQQGTETGLSQDDDLGTIQWKGYNGTALETVARIQGQFQTGIANAGHLIFSASETDDGTLSKVLRLRRVGLVPHDDITTSNKAEFVIGSAYNAIDTVYTETIQGPQGMDIHVDSDVGDTIIHIGTQGTYEGLVGIGLETPQSSLHVEGEIIGQSQSSSGGLLSLLASKSDWAHVTAGATQGKVGFGLVDLPNTSSPIYGALITVSATEPWSTGNYGSQIEFNVHPNSQGSHNMGITKMSLSGDTLDLNVATADFGGADLTINQINATGDIDTSADVSCNNMNVNGSLNANSFESNSYENSGGSGILTWDNNTNDIIIGETNEYDFVIRAGNDVGTNQEMVKIDNESETTHFRGPILMGNHGDIHVSGSIGTSNGGHKGTVPSPGGLYAGTTSLEHKTSQGWPYDETDWTDRAPVLYVEQTHTGNDPFVAVFTNVRDNDDTDGLQIILGKGQNTHENAYSLTSPAATNRYIAFCSPTMSYDPTANIPVNGGILGEHYWWSGVTSVGSISGDDSGGIRTNGISFTGTHDACSTETIEEGMIVDSTGELWISIGISTSLPYIAKSTTAKSKTVYGVVESNEIRSGRANAVKDKKGYTVNALGEGKVWVTTIGGEPTNGDYITSSLIVGHGQLQDDDILHSYTVAKLTENIDWSAVSDTVSHEGQTYKKYLAGCTYHCG